MKELNKRAQMLHFPSVVLSVCCDSSRPSSNNGPYSSHRPPLWGRHRCMG